MDMEEARRIKVIREKRRRRKRKRTMQILRRLGIFVVAVIVFVVSVNLITRYRQESQEISNRNKIFSKVVQDAPEFQVELLTPNSFSRPQTALEEVKGIVIHYTANPGTSAEQNRNYFEGLKDSKSTNASSHFIVGIQGEILQCIPSSEIAYASNDRNADTLSIECCHWDETGEFSEDTYQSLVHLTAWLCGKFNLTTEDVIRHYDVTGKPCPLYYVENPQEWEEFLEDVQDYINENGVAQEEPLS